MVEEKTELTADKESLSFARRESLDSQLVVYV